MFVYKTKLKYMFNQTANFKISVRFVLKIKSYVHKNKLYLSRFFIIVQIVNQMFAYYLFFSYFKELFVYRLWKDDITKLFIGPDQVGLRVYTPKPRTSE